MCGIAGKLAFNPTYWPEETQLKSMGDAIAHRGPDDSGVFIDGPCGLAHRRLSIIDLSPRGHQPMSIMDGRYTISFNGEIYNYQELRDELVTQGVTFVSDSDTEVLLHLFARHGTSCLQRLRGMFAFGIWDKEKQELFLARDRLGQKPLKYYIDDKQFVFASELKAILSTGVKKQIDWDAIQDYLKLGYVPGPMTGFKGIAKLPPAHYAIVSTNGTMVTERYWELDYKTKPSQSTAQWREQVTDTLTEAVRLRMISDVPVGAHLSGGIDSGIITALMAQNSSEPVRTFSIGFEGDTDSELPRARQIADRYGTQHHEFVVNPSNTDILADVAAHYEEPFADSSALPTWLLSELTREHVTVALNGDGGDENFSGYNRYHLMGMYETLKKIDPLVQGLHKPGVSVSQSLYKFSNKKIFRKVQKLLKWYSAQTHETYQRQFGFFNEVSIAKLLPRATKNSPFPLKNLFAQTNSLQRVDQLLAVDIASYLPDDLLVKVDMASMAHALEVRSPFLDHVLMELTASMPVELKRQGKRGKILLKEIATGLLPKEIVKQKKRGFGIPRETWLRGSLQTYVEEQLFDEEFLRHGFNRGHIEQLIQEHTQRRSDHSLRLWSLIMLKHWLKAWFT
ncbi:MAG: asparagine synthase (glutamine-hydrolyzing) [Parcubacteria group bacterium]|nr:asparagine synthase (glutamine-hydrolyzing) [Parcubacteria group bacterium]